VKFEYSNQQTPQSERAHRIQLSTVIQSICCFCYHTIAYSASLDVLIIAERAHQCVKRDRMLKLRPKRAA
jgi:hypothetical protein